MAMTNYVPKEDFMGEWTAIPTKTKDGIFALWFTYELETRPNQPEQWVQMKTWEIESIEAQRGFVILCMKNKKDNINLLLHCLHQSFFHVYARINDGADAKHFNWEGLSQSTP